MKKPPAPPKKPSRPPPKRGQRTATAGRIMNERAMTELAKTKG